MADAVEAHHQLMRPLIVRYGCYEVKTVGDSFMIACRGPLAAVQLAGALQRCFLHHDWGTTALDDSYREFELQKAEEDVEYKPPTAHLDPCVYRELWNGLRVRVGIHTGLCDIRLDEVTKGYDYYGSTSNMAARTESIANGGQVLLTRGKHLALGTAEREHVSVTSLGATALRGVPDPVEIYQLDAVPGRTFTALRIGPGCRRSSSGGQLPVSMNVARPAREAALRGRLLSRSRCCSVYVCCPINGGFLCCCLCDGASHCHARIGAPEAMLHMARFRGPSQQSLGVLLALMLSAAASLDPIRSTGVAGLCFAIVLCYFAKCNSELCPSDAP
ncbi:unnamed protein product [Trypanosoma congolense IL3000]|uniref:adenylate cyclase n=1 Tax=Trypanosoma congolense (strain IL3000) TaxID=1068625 RepID=F9WF46_TRYCI|nr:unnamed protein product [Trypanosoma congolense IL3000]